MAEYDAFAESYITQQEHGDLAKAVELPAMTRRVGRVKGLRVLDLGCGLGHHVRHYLKNGAVVTAVDNAKTLLHHVPLKAKTLCQDLNKKLPFNAASFDVVTCSLVLEHVKNFQKLINEANRVLVPGGKFYCSIPNPLLHQEESFVGMQHDGHDVDIYGNYFYPRKIIIEHEDARMTKFHRTLTDYFKAFKKAGFIFEDLEEIQPPRSLKKKDVLGYAFASRNPVFILFVLAKP